MFHYSMLAGDGASGMDQAGMNCSFASKQASITLEYIVKREESLVGPSIVGSSSTAKVSLIKP
jgi:hypothetical protein